MVSISVTLAQSALPAWGYKQGLRCWQRLYPEPAILPFAAVVRDNARETTHSAGILYRESSSGSGVRRQSASGLGQRAPLRTRAGTANVASDCDCQSRSTSKLYDLHHSTTEVQKWVVLPFGSFRGSGSSHCSRYPWLLSSPKIAGDRQMVHHCD